jgi:hypothetical protein
MQSHATRKTDVIRVALDRHAAMASLAYRGRIDRRPANHLAA